MKLISIEGNIGSGKSTFVNILKAYYKDNNRVCFLDEPVDTWNTIVDDNGETIIENYYRDQKKYAFSFQMMAYISRLALLKRAIQNKEYDIIISERSLSTDKYVFCQMLYDDKIIDTINYSIYNKWFDEFNIDIKTQYVYLKTDPSIAYDRIQTRARKGEIIPLAYLTICDKYHNEWLKNKDVLELDANNNKEDKDVMNDWLDKVNTLL